MDFDTEKFISEVRERPAIWDSRCAADRSEKLQCWDEIIDIYAKENDTSEDRKELGKVLMKKWRNIRDNFVKASKNLKNAKSDSGAKQKSPYTYFNMLLFLKDSTYTMVNETDSDTGYDVSQNHDGPFEKNEKNGPSQNVARKRRKKTNNEDVIGKQLISVLKKNLECKKEMENDEDKLFLLSLLTEFKKIPEPNKLEARCEIIRAIQKFQFKMEMF